MRKLNNRFLSLLSAMVLTVGSGITLADDTDIYFGGTPPEESEPVIMMSLDWRPNLGIPACSGGECQFLIDEGYLASTGPYTYFDLLRAVLRKVMDPLEGVKVGLMMNHDYKNNCENNVSNGCSNGGFIAVGAKSFSDPDNKEAFHAYLDAVPLPQGNASHKYQGKELFFEMYRYLKSGGIYNGHVGYLDFSTESNKNMPDELPLVAGKQTLSWDTSIESSNNYISPLEGSNSCAKLSTVNIMFQISQQDSDSDDAIEADMNGLPNNPTFPNVLAWLHDADLGDADGTQNVTSYFIVDETKINTTTMGYANAGGTPAPLALSDDPEELVDAIAGIFDEVLSVSTSFVSASIPVNVFNRAEIVDNVYIATFQPDDDVRPAWDGNLKKLRLGGLDTGSPVLIDANNVPAIAADGRIKFNALTYWTKGAALPAPDTDAGEIAGKDGRVAGRGGSGQIIPGFLGSPYSSKDLDDRNIYYEDGTSTLVDLDNTAAADTDIQTALGVGDQTDAEAMIAYIRGHDVDDVDVDGNRTEPREWLFGDSLHARPLPINFGTRATGYTSDNPGIFIAVGSNDGFMRMIRNTTTGGAQSGEEVWAFMPKEVMDKVATVRTNAPGIKHPYMVDGAPTAYINELTGDTSLFFALRRGGQALYALDITDPEAPEFMWKVTPTELSGLGYTFSAPRVIKVHVDGETDPIPALVFGGGYDLDKDYVNNPGVGTDDSEGNAIFVIRADNGALLWKATHTNLKDSVPSSVAILDSDGNGEHDRFYVGDTGGNVWRGDMPPTGESDWKLTQLASFGRHASGAGGKEDDLRFFHRPDVVLSGTGDDGFDAVVITSGDRADPLDKAGGNNNWAYMIKDKNLAVGGGDDSDMLELDDLGDVTETCLLNGGTCTADVANGWALAFEADGEKGLSTPLTIANIVYFTTYLPPGSSVEESCGPAEGNGRLYAVSLKDASAVNDYDTTTEDEERFSELKSRGIPAEVVSLPPKSILRPDLQTEETGATTRFQTYWFENEDDDL